MNRVWRGRSTQKWLVCKLSLLRRESLFSQRELLLVNSVHCVGMRLKWTCFALGVALTGLFLVSQRIYSATVTFHTVSDAIQPSLSEIVARMVTYRHWQDEALREYQARRTFQAVNDRFNMNSTLEVRTIFKWPFSMESTVLRQEGSSFIREHVFEKILAAETEFASKDDADIIPKNYDFELIGKEDCAGLRCWHLSLKPKRKDKYLLDGEVWVDATDYGVYRVHGSPSKRISMWVSKVEIDKRHRRLEGVWLPEKIESSSNIRFAGSVGMKIEYTYDVVKVISPTTARK